jgi:hypothetical protein
MANKNKKNDTTVTILSGGYRSMKSTERYTPDTAPINFQDQVQEKILMLPPLPPPSTNSPEETKKEDKKPRQHIELKPFKPLKKINIPDSFLQSSSRVYILGSHPGRGNKILRNRKIIDYIIDNYGTYRVIVLPHLKNIFLSIIENGDYNLLGKEISSSDRERIVNIFKKDNAMA